MATDPTCEECAAIVLEYERAYLEFWVNASEETREGCRAIGQLVTGGTEDDLARAHEVLRPFKPFYDLCERRCADEPITHGRVVDSKVPACRQDWTLPKVASPGPSALAAVRPFVRYVFPLSPLLQSPRLLSSCAEMRELS
jgi:hypothetical protein